MSERLMLTPEQVENISFLRKKGYTQQQIADNIGISRQTVSYQLKKIKNSDSESMEKGQETAERKLKIGNKDADDANNLATLLAATENLGVVLDIGSGRGDFAIELANKNRTKVIAFEDNNHDFRSLMRGVVENSLEGVVEGISLLPCNRRDEGEIEQNIGGGMIDQLGFLGAISAIRISEGMDLASFLGGADRTIRGNWPILMIHKSNCDGADFVTLLSEYNYSSHVFSGYFLGLNNEKHAKIFEMASNIDNNSTITELFSRGKEIDRLRRLNRDYYTSNYRLTKENIALKRKLDKELIGQEIIEKVVETCKEVQNRYDSSYSALFYGNDSNDEGEKNPYPRALRSEISRSIDKISDLERDFAQNRLKVTPTKYIDLPYLSWNDEEEIGTRIGIASIPQRSETLKETIISLHDQVDEIFISLNGYEKACDLYI